MKLQADSKSKDDTAQKQLEEQKKMNNWLQQIYDNTNVTLYSGL